MAEIFTTWFGAFGVEQGRIIRAHPFPPSLDEIRERWRIREGGGIVPEEETLRNELEEGGLVPITSRDRRLHSEKIGWASGYLPEVDPRAYGIPPAWERELTLGEARESLDAAWDPSLHVDEAVRSLGNLDGVLNILGERLGSWAAREGSGDADVTLAEARRVAQGLLGETPEEGRPSDLDPELATARRTLARAYLDADEARQELEAALEKIVPRRYPNLAALAGPLLAARLISKAGGLKRLARLPASTVQVLGAERAFFDHLRTRSPPPRHGLLFLHPDVHSAPRFRRGRIARALAGKIVIAARLDAEGTPLREALRAQYENRRAEILKAGPSHISRRPEPSRVSVQPGDRRGGRPHGRRTSRRPR